MIKRDAKGRFAKGQSANPKGRKPKGQTFTDAIRSEFTPQELAKQLRKHINKGSVAALKYAYDRMEGTPKQTVAVENEREAQLLEKLAEIDGQLLHTEATDDIHKLPEKPAANTDT